MKYCNRGRDLLKELKKAEWLPRYDERAVNEIKAEIDHAYEDLYSLVEDDDDDEEEENNNLRSPKILYLNSSILRNGRFLHAYISYRCKRILEVRKEAGPVLPSSIEQGVLGQNELYFFNKYGDCLTDYSSNVGLDLTANLEPPSSINIEIRVLEDCGELLTEDGRLTLKQGTTLFVKKSNVEHLIRQGKCKQL